MTAETLARTEARRIILEHATDIEPLSISEMLEDLELPEHEHDELINAVDAAITSAKVTVHWEESE